MGVDPVEQAGTGNARKMLAQSEKALEDVLAAFELMAESMLSGKMVPITELARTRTALGYTRAQLLDEVRQHEKRTSLEHGLVPEAPLDFDSLRNEIGRKLDRIRSTLDSEGISE